MFLEKDFEDILSKYPEIIEEGLELKGRQTTVFSRRIDLLFEDRFKRRLIVELKRGPIKDEHIGQILSYEGMLLSADDPTIRVMLIGNRVPPNIRRTLDHHGIAWREISFIQLKDFLNDKEDVELLSRLDDTSELQRFNGHFFNKSQPGKTSEKMLSPDEIVSKIKATDEYNSFRNILDEKRDHEEQAKKLILDNLGAITKEILKKIIELVDKPYPYIRNDKVVNGPWFGRLLNSNTNTLFETDTIKINYWFNTITNSYLPVDRKFYLLLSEQYNIKGINVGFITLVLYLIDKESYSVWFEGLHDGYRKLFPETEKFNAKVEQYLVYNKASKEFAQKYGFEHTELDWIFSTGVNLIIKAGPKPQQITIFEQIKDVCTNRNGEIVTSGDVITEIGRKFGTAQNSIMLSDYCYNRMNVGTHHGRYLFEFIEPGKFKYLGENFPYSGLIYSKPAGEEVEQVIGEWENGQKYLKENVSFQANIDQSKYRLDDIFVKQGTIPLVRDLVAEFHQSLQTLLSNLNLSWWSRTHISGISYFCNRIKAFMAINIASSHFIVHYYTGDSIIEGLEKSTWVDRDDNKGSKPFWIRTSGDIKTALAFAEKAYRISISGRSNTDHPYYEYWDGFRHYMERQKSKIRIRRPQSKNWTDISIGNGDIYLAAGFNTNKKVLMVWLVINGENSKQVFDFLHRNYYRESLEKISQQINWSRMDHNKRSAVILEKDADIFDLNSREEQYRWFKEYIEKYESFFNPIIANLKYLARE